jgi:hypothetical protein
MPCIISAKLAQRPSTGKLLPNMQRFGPNVSSRWRTTSRFSAAVHACPGTPMPDTFTAVFALRANSAVATRHPASASGSRGTGRPQWFRMIVVSGWWFASRVASSRCHFAVASRVLRNQPIEDGFEVEGLGKANVDRENKIVAWNDILVINKNSIDGLIKQGL